MRPARVPKSRRTVPLDHWLGRQRLYRAVFAACVFTLIGARLIWTGDERERIWERDERAPVKLTGVDPDSVLRVHHAQDIACSARVRLIGVEIADPRGAQQWIGENCSQGELMLTFDQSTRRDKAGNLLGYVYTTSGTMVNDALIAQGFARPDDTPHLIAGWFKKVENTAKRRKQGVWKEFAADERR